jgi:hypothetical protein
MAVFRAPLPKKVIRSPKALIPAVVIGVILKF